MTAQAVSTPLESSTVGNVLTLTLNRPQSLNSLTPTLLAALLAELVRAKDADPVRCVVLRGAGRAFCSGQALDADPEPVKVTLGQRYNPIIRAIVEMDKPVIAAVHGVAAGAGASLALACDFRVMTDSARLRFLFSRVALVADAGCSWFLPRLIGHSRATELLMLGGEVTAEQAQELGLAHRVVSLVDLNAAVDELAGALTSSPAALALIKRQLRASSTASLDQQLELEIRCQELAVETSDFQEGLAAFIEKRAPRFTGR